MRAVWSAEGVTPSRGMGRAGRTGPVAGSVMVTGVLLRVGLGGAGQCHAVRGEKRDRIYGHPVLMDLDVKMTTSALALGADPRDLLPGGHGVTGGDHEVRFFHVPVDGDVAVAVVDINGVTEPGSGPGPDHRGGFPVGG